jgi:queuine tRNA-ribosyltransferase
VSTAGVLDIEARDGAARTGTLMTAHGPIRIPAFMPVGTHASIKACHPDEVRACGADVVLCNAYHLALRPGVEVVEDAGGLHGFMGWDGPILTDSGGYQLVSLGGVAAVDGDGAVFVSPYDGSRMRIGPADAVSIQARLGADILMCLDHPVTYGSRDDVVGAATDRTHRWAERCRAAHPGEGRLLFGIVQGGFDRARRAASAREIAALDFDGVAIGGLVLGEPPPVTEALTRVVVAELPEELPRYVMGLGTEAELLAAIATGVDLFDCVLPTRLARNGTALTTAGRLPLRRAEFHDDPRPIEEGCPCPACGRFSRAYLRHLFAAGEILGHRLVSLHNLTHLGRFMGAARTAIRQSRLAAFRAEVFDRLTSLPVRSEVLGYTSAP